MNFSSCQKANAFNPIALRKAKTVYIFGLSECNKVKVNGYNGTRKRNSTNFTFISSEMGPAPKDKIGTGVPFSVSVYKTETENGTPMPM